MVGRRSQDLFPFLPVLAVGIAVFSWTPFAIVDDAFISFRYADQLATTGHLVFNPGERVEGISNLLWTLILAAQKLTFDCPFERFAVGFSLALILLAALRLVQINRLLAGSSLVGPLAACVLLLTSDVVLALANGLEGALYMALLTEVVYRYARRRIVAAFLAAGLLFLTRPEGFFVGFLLAVVSLRERPLRRAAGRGLAVFFVICLGATAFRMAYFGSPVPNSIVAKHVDLLAMRTTLRSFYGRAVPDYFGRFFAGNPHLVLLLAVLCASVAILRSKPERGLSLFCLGAILLSWLVAAQNGGDWMPHHRLLTQYGALYVAALLLLPYHRLAPRVVLALVVAWAAVQGVRVASSRPSEGLGIRIDGGPNIPFWGEALRRLAPRLAPTDRVSAEAIGYLGFHLRETQIHDPLGLTDAYLARHGRPAPRYGREDVDYTLGEVRPSVLVWHWLGHVRAADQGLLDRYAAFCAADCTSWEADVVMIRRDRLGELGPAFSEWRRIRVVDGEIQLE
jgi:hypothetical protein